MPARYLVSLIDDPTGVGIRGVADAEHSGGFTASAVPVEADGPAEAVSKTLTGTFTVTFEDRTESYTLTENGVS